MSWPCPSIIVCEAGDSLKPGGGVGGALRFTTSLKTVAHFVRLKQRYRITTIEDLTTVFVAQDAYNLSLGKASASIDIGFAG